MSNPGSPEGQKDADTVATKLNAHEWADWFESPQGAARLSMEGRRNIAALLRLLTDLPLRSPEGAPAGQERALLEKIVTAGAAYEADPVDNRDRASSWAKLTTLLVAIHQADAYLRTPTPTDAPGDET